MYTFLTHSFVPFPLLNLPSLSLLVLLHLFSIPTLLCLRALLQALLQLQVLELVTFLDPGEKNQEIKTEHLIDNSKINN